MVGGPLAGTVAWKGNNTENERRETFGETVTAVSKQVALLGSATSFRDFFVSYWALANRHLQTAVRDFVSGSALNKDTPIPCKKNSRATIDAAVFR